MSSRWKICNNPELFKIFVEVKNEARRLGYPIDELKLYHLYLIDSPRSYGRCQYSKTGTTIAINKNYLANPQAARDTIVHEIAHALTKGDHHGAKWKATGDAIGAKWNLTMTRTAQREDIPDLQENCKYIIQCPKCEQLYKYQRCSDAVKHPNLYRCGKCKSSLVRIQ